jgi:hypothetical protein
MEYLGRSICDVELRLLCMMSGASALVCGTVIGLLTL